LRKAFCASCSACALSHRLMVVISCIFFLLALSQPTDARVRVITPEHLLEDAGAVVVGTVLERGVLEDDALKMVLRVDEVLTGKVSEPVTTIRVAAPAGGYSAPPKRRSQLAQMVERYIPPEGTQVFVPLQEITESEHRWQVEYAHCNGIPTMDPAVGRPGDIHHSMRFGKGDIEWGPEDFLAAYRAFYREHHVAPAEACPPPDQGEAGGGQGGNLFARWLRAVVNWFGALFRGRG